MADAVAPQFYSGLWRAQLNCPLNVVRIELMGEELSWSRADAREFDRRAIEDYGIPSAVLMENAGRGASDWIIAHAEELGLSETSPVVVLCGPGNNGGDGFVLARHLTIAGFTVTVVEIGAQGSVRPDRELFKAICLRMGLVALTAKEAFGEGGALAESVEAPLWVDSVLGTGFQGPMREALNTEMELVRDAIERSRAPVVALDLPSGMDADSGALGKAHIGASFTLTLGALKRGFSEPRALLALGEVHVVGLGAPFA
jgi:NAD(P)H-hydrate epimerase